MTTITFKKTLIAAAIGSSLAVTLPAQAQDAYEYTLVDPPGSVSGQIFSINERGDAVGNANLIDSDGNFAGSISYEYGIRKGMFDLIDDVEGFDFTSILGNNDRGSLVGSVDDIANNRTSGVLIEKNGDVTIFDHPNAPSFTQARAINSRGTITGFREADDPAQVATGFIYDGRQDAFTDIVPSFFTIAQGINARGTVVGSAIFQAQDDPCNPGAPPGPIVRYGWLRDVSGNVTFFTVNAGLTSARGISDAGTITGFTVDPGTGQTIGFVVNDSIANCDDLTVGPDAIVAVPDAAATFPQSISNWGAVVGSYVDADGMTRSFVAVPD